jgi:MOSC domain-containing protein YiiM
MVIGRVRALSLQTQRGAPPMRAERAVAVAGAGFEGDIHADPVSPRQLLLASASVYDAFDLPAHALRENLLLDVDTASLTSGTVLQLGEAVRIRLMFQCEACGQLDVQRRGLATALGSRRGMLARVIAGGTVVVGDTIMQLDDRLPAWSDDWRERVMTVLDAVPPGHVIDYARLARVAGIQSSYCRAFPRLLARLGADHAAKAVPARTTVTLPRWDGSGLFDRM